MATELDSLYVSLRAETEAFRAGINEASASLEGLESHANLATSGLRTLQEEGALAMADLEAIGTEAMRGLRRRDWRGDYQR